MKTPEERRRERREEKLQEVERGVEAGTLVIRKMTPAERAKYPARPAQGRGRR